tara:strand:- start:356 stop:1123 length:768 start_codon:yes stop_codon:yes gene_type:complete
MKVRRSENRRGRKSHLAGVRSGGSYTRGEKDTTRSRRVVKKPLTRMDDPTSEELRECIRAQHCWWCDTDGWKVLSLHTWAAHGINAFELRRLAGVYRNTPTCSKEISVRRAVAPHSRVNVLKAQEAKRQRLNDPNYVPTKRNMSEAAKERCRQVLAAARTPELMARALAAANEATRKPHNCRICGALIPQRNPRVCPGECRRLVRQETGRRSGVVLAERMKDPDFRERVRQNMSAGVKASYAQGRVLGNPRIKGG